ncbi:hypothetical protein [Pontibacter ramchanderi]|uniref:Uncharacterized protein n=1 Tax=Pontibacter ramchanderi TaxID=1179743 RepID=A0A2N3V2D9_9BACT|nr:hypothetical protein [Pontibacter ramchanderi]PKV75780.1 hypothetical protein BD749_0726 [Pontibacter ramchanderi]
MRDYRDYDEGDYNRHNEQEWPRQQYYRNERPDWNRRPEDEEAGRQYRARYEESRRMPESDYRGTMEDFYNTTYETNNYSGVPRHDEYGLPHGTENDLGSVSRGNPRFYNPDRFERTRYRYSTGYNPNYDNPEEGDLYRNFDSRGNHGYRHDASYGNADEFRDFGDDHYGSRDKSGRY